LVPFFAVLCERAHKGQELSLLRGLVGEAPFVVLVFKNEPSVYSEGQQCAGNAQSWWPSSSFMRWE
jgi:hypothetical protein